MPQDVGHLRPRHPIPGPPNAPGESLGVNLVTVGTPHQVGERASKSPRSGLAAPPLLGLVNTVTSHTRQHLPGGLGGPDYAPSWQVEHREKWRQWVAESDGESTTWEEFNRWFATQRRLSKMRRRTLTRSRVQVEEVSALWPEHSVDFVTLTYRPGDEWSSKHIAHAANCYRVQAARDGIPFRYEWVAELQLKRMRRRGESARECLHYHMLVWRPAGYEFPKPDSRGWWSHGMSNVEVARNPVGYLSKYASKGTDGEALPSRVRISGGGGLSEAGRREVAWWLLPRYVREAFPVVGQKVKRELGGGWLNWDEGVFLDAVTTW